MMIVTLVDYKQVEDVCYICTSETLSIKQPKVERNTPLH